MGPGWFKPRRYRHFDQPVTESFAARAESATFVSRHPFSPMLRFIKKTKRYRADERKTKIKERPIMFASHRDACILSYYSSVLATRLEAAYANEALGVSVLAYRKLGQANYDFAAQAFEFARAISPCEILAFDVSRFFDTLDHRRLKVRLKQILGVESLPDDWYAVLRHVTSYHYVDREELAAHPHFRDRFIAGARGPLASIPELKSAGIAFHRNACPGKGVPQGTPISAGLSNLYMLDFDRSMTAYATSIGALYLRYSDDILIVCKPEHSAMAEARVRALLTDEQLTLNDEKFERTPFDLDDRSGSAVAQYLGFSLTPTGPALRPGSISRHLRRMRWAVRRAVAVAAASKTHPGTIFTKGLRRRFSGLPARNFSSYANRSAEAFESGSRIRRQARRLERAFERALAEAKADAAAAAASSVPPP